VQDVTFNGIETAVAVTTPTLSERFQIGYTVLQASQKAFPGISKYVFNYPYHQAALSWSSQPLSQISLYSRLGVVQRVGIDPYAVWDLTASRSQGRVRPFIQLSNLSDSKYQEIAGVDMPGRSIVVGMELVFKKAKRH
jgi:iron complex outermembrane receptor protein